MISIDSESVYLLELVKAALFGFSPTFNANTNWETVFESAKSQCIVPLVSACVPEKCRDKWNEITCQSKACFMRLLFEQNALVNLLRNNHIPFVILKGTAAAIYYPHPALRTFGDIDFYVSDNYLESALEILKVNGYILIHSNERHYGYDKNGIDFELHTRFSCQSYNDIDHIIQRGLKNAVNYHLINNSFPGLPTYENGIVLLGHIMQHLKDNGIGLRQIIDWEMYVHKELNDTAWFEHFQPLAAEAGLEKLAVTVTFMCKKWLGLPNEITWCNAADEDVADQLLIRILDDGNFGHVRAANERIKKNMYKEGTFKYLHRAGMNNWTLAQKYPVFRPFAWLYQLCRYAINVIAGLFTGKKVFMKNKNYMSLEELWESLE